MDVLKAQLLRIQQQLSGLSASQKMLTASLVAIMIMTLVWWSRFAGTADMEPVLDQSLSAADIGHIKATLDSRGISAKVIGDRVMVSSDRKIEAVATLAYENALPSNASTAWDEMTKQMSPWDSRSKTDSIQNHMRERMISDVIQGYFPGVSSANVIINPLSERRVGSSMEPSASVVIKTRGGGELNVKRLVEAAASTVASAVAGLNRSRVSVVVDGVPRRVYDSSDSMGGGDLYDQIQTQEKYATEKIQSLLQPGTLVAVTVDLDTISSQETRETYDPTKVVSKEKRIETSNEENSQPTPQSTEVGAQPNTGLALTVAPVQTGSSNTRETSKTDLENFPSVSRETLIKPGGKPTVVSAAVRLPRSYFVNKYKANNPNAKEPDDAILQPIVNAELPAVRNVVQKCVAMKSEDSISVDMYYDGGLPMLMAAEPSAGSASSVTGLVGGHAKEIAVGALAIISLFMVSMIVRKGAPAPVVAAQPEPKDTPRLTGIEDVAGIVGGEGHTTLDGMELDDDAIHAQQMVEQVQTMVKEDPDAAANLVKRWLNRS